MCVCVNFNYLVVIQLHIIKHLIFCLYEYMNRRIPSIRSRLMRTQCLIYYFVLLQTHTDTHVTQYDRPMRMHVSLQCRRYHRHMTSYAMHTLCGCVRVCSQNANICNA